MRHRNLVLLLGNAGNDPEIVRNEKVEVASFSLYTTRNWKDESGNWQDASERHTVKCFGPLAGVAEEHITKGMTVDVEGELRCDTYTDSEGAKRTTSYIRARALRFDTRSIEGAESGSEEQS